MKALLWILFCASASAAAAPEPAPIKLAPHVWAVFEVHADRREPDGNSVIFEAPSGLIVVDTGRHRAHRDSLLQLATKLHRPIAAIINTHWHLDHVSGNPYVRMAYPELNVYASDAIDGALKGFLADSLKDSPKYLADDTLPAETREDIAADRLAILDGAALKPDVVVSSSRRLTIAGKRLKINLAKRAATAGDVWVVDEGSGTAVLGDLVTLPAPYFETACPDGWSKALELVSRTQFKRAVPGHGPTMSAADVRLYKIAFDEFLRCTASDTSAAQCAGAWLEGVRPLLLRGRYDSKGAERAALYYVGLLRRSNFQERYCELD